jgi:hypothetical protein
MTYFALICTVDMLPTGGDKQQADAWLCLPFIQCCTGLAQVDATLIFFVKKKHFVSTQCTGKLSFD